jgi:hypothetical protein
MNKYIHIHIYYIYVLEFNYIIKYIFVRCVRNNVSLFE